MLRWRGLADKSSLEGHQIDQMFFLMVHFDWNMMKPSGCYLQTSDSSTKTLPTLDQRWTTKAQSERMITHGRKSLGIHMRTSHICGHRSLCRTLPRSTWAFSTAVGTSLPEMWMQHSDGGKLLWTLWTCTEHYGAKLSTPGETFAGTTTSSWKWSEPWQRTEWISETRYNFFTTWSPAADNCYKSKPRSSQIGHQKYVSINEESKVLSSRSSRSSFNPGTASEWSPWTCLWMRREETTSWSYRKVSMNTLRSKFIVVKIDVWLRMTCGVVILGKAPRPLFVSDEEVKRKQVFRSLSLSLFSLFQLSGTIQSHSSSKPLSVYSNLLGIWLPISAKLWLEVSVMTYDSFHLHMAFWFGTLCSLWQLKHVEAVIALARHAPSEENALKWWHCKAIWLFATNGFVSQQDHATVFDLRSFTLVYWREMFNWQRTSYLTCN